MRFACPLFLLIFASAAFTQPSSVADEVKKAYERRQFEGVVACYAKGSEVARATYGLASPTWDVPVDVECRFPIGSMTEQFTAALLMRAVERGEIGLDTTVGDVWPERKDGSTGLVTIRHMLLHISGLANVEQFVGPETRVELRRGELAHFTRSILPEFESLDTAAAAILAAPVVSAPGLHRLNRSEPIVIAAMLEKRTGKSFADLLRTEILEPLGLKNTGLLTSTHEVKRLVEPVESANQDARLGHAVRWENYGPAAGMYSTAGDLARWSDALFSGKVVTPTAIADLQIADPLSGFASWGGAVLAVPLPSGPTNVIEVMSVLGSFRSLLIQAPGHQATIVILSNSDRYLPRSSFRSGTLGNSILKVMFPAKESG